MTVLLDKAEHAPISVGEEDVRQYLHQIREYPRLTAEEERELARRCAEGDEAAIRQMVNSNLRLVVSIARGYAGLGVPLMDLIQEGSIGLLAAARKFDYTLDYRFSTYATKWIRQGVTRYLMNHRSTIRVPLHTLEKMRRIESIRTALHQEKETEPTLEEIAARAELPAEKVRELMQLMPEVCSLDLFVGEDEQTALLSMTEDATASQPQEELVRRELVSMVEQLLSALNDRQRQILRLHYGMEDGVCHSLEQIGRELGISKERVRQIESQAMLKILKLGANMGLEDYLE